MNFWHNYQDLFKSSIEEDQHYEKIIKQVLEDIDKSLDFCHQ